jgi:hypothetical protein
VTNLDLITLTAALLYQKKGATSFAQAVTDAIELTSESLRQLKARNE